MTKESTMPPRQMPKGSVVITIPASGQPTVTPPCAAPAEAPPLLTFQKKPVPVSLNDPGRERGPGWAYADDGAVRRKPLSHQTRRAYACARWMMRGRLMHTPAGAVIERPEGHWHFLDGAWHGPYKWTGSVEAMARSQFTPLPISKWVTLYGRLPDLPVPPPIPRPPFEPYWHYYDNRWHGPTGRNCHPAECRIHVYGLARPIANPPAAPPPITREEIIFLARVISGIDDPAERAAASRDFAATDFKTKGKFDQGDVRFGRLVFTAPKRPSV